MQRSPSTRVLAAILFTDMVNSTTFAEELGDRRWKALVDRHHQIVRRELKRFGGVELDTAGDGFFASFKEPASAIACACACADGVRELGVELRAGVHFGECERIGKKLGGITVVIAARIMALGGPGDVLVSATAAELARGAGFGVENRGTHILKGVEGHWRVVGVTSVEGEVRKAPLDAEEEAARRRAIQPASPGRRLLMPALIAAVLVLGAGIALLLAQSGHAKALVPGPDTLARIDPVTASFAQVISVGQHAFPDALVWGAGKIWAANVGNGTVSEIDPATGTRRDFGAPSTPTGVAYEGGSIWVSYGFSSDPKRRVDVLDLANPGLAPAGFGVPDGSYPVTGGAGAVWIADPLGSTLTRFDPVSRLATSVALPPGAGPVALQASMSRSSPLLWVASGAEPYIYRVDALHPKTPVASFGTGKVPSALAVAPDGSVWVVSREGFVLALSASGTTTVPERSLGDRCEGPAGVAASANAVWVSCSLSGTTVRLDPSNGAIMSVLRVSGSPGPMTIDPQGDVWVAVRGL